MKRTLLLIASIALFTTVHAQNDSIKIGATYKGGIIFQVNENGDHGLIATPINQNTTKTAWGKNGKTRALSMTDGKANTELIVRFAKVNNMPDKFAACLCDTLTLGGYTDWYLPALDELKELYINRAKVPNIQNDDYTSSTEIDGQEVWNIHFDKSKPVFHYNKNNNDYYVRCIRRF